MNSGKSTFLGLSLLLLCFNLLTGQNNSSLPKKKVADDVTPPVAVCDSYEQVSLTAIPTKVYASTFDDGSYDDECLDKFYFVVKRMGDPDINFKPYIDFYCEDVANSPIKVVLRVFDCSGNYNDCWSSVTVEDKTKPILWCPADLTIDCLVDVSPYWGTPIAVDNCGTVKLTSSITDATDQCQQGYVIRTWTGKDQFNNQSTCSQRIYKKHVSDYSVTFPDDVTITDCIKPSDLNNTGVPTFMNKDCELVAIEHIDHDLPITNGDGCFVRIRKWKLISWCNYDPFAPTHTNLGIPLGGKKYKDDDGYFEYAQYIKVFESSKPILTCKDTVICVNATDCTADFTIPTPAVVDCSPQITFGISGDLGTKPQVTKVPPGIYNIDHNVSDGCGNHSFCSTKIEVKDCKKPTPVVINGLSTTLMVQTGQVTVWASDFNQSSYDNCTPSGKLVFSFSPDTTDKFKVFDCDSLGIRTVKIYATDQAGNVDFAVTTIDIQDNMNACDSSAMIVQLSGNVKKANGESLSAVNVNSEMIKVVSDSIGAFNAPMMKIPMPALLTIDKSGIAKEGLSIIDIILVKNHITGSKKLKSPYELLAADINRSGSITVADIWQMQQVIINAQTEWKNNKTWNFVDKNKIYEPVESIWADTLSELTLTEENPDSVKIELIGVKTGDITGQSNVYGKLQVRGTSLLDVTHTNGLYNLVYSSKDELNGFQASFTFNNEAIQQLHINLPEDQYFIEKKDNQTLLTFLAFNNIKPGQVLASWNQSAEAYYPEISDNIDPIAVDLDYQINQLRFKNEKLNKSFIVSDCYPDPALNTVSINLTSASSENININITDVQGRNLGNYSKVLIPGKNNIQLNLNLETGTYFMTFVAGERNYTRKFHIVR